MNTRDLELCCSKYKLFCGVYPRDMLPIPRQRPCIIVANTDRSHERGTHWVAFYFTETTDYYFDSYGLYPSQLEFVMYLNKYSHKNWVYNCKQLQGVSSAVCGHYVTLFTRCMSKGYSFDEFVHMFSNNHVENDKLVCKMVTQVIKCQSNTSDAQSCHSLLP